MNIDVTKHVHSLKRTVLGPASLGLSTYVQEPNISFRDGIYPRNLTHRTHFSRTPLKPEYLIIRSQLAERGPLGFGPWINF